MFLVRTLSPQFLCNNADYTTFLLSNHEHRNRHLYSVPLCNHYMKSREHNIDFRNNLDKKRHNYILHPHPLSSAMLNCHMRYKENQKRQTY